MKSDRQLLAMIQDLTNREREILGMVAQGITSPDIAAQLGITHHVVRRHLQHVYKKLEVENRVQAALIYNKVMKPG